MKHPSHDISISISAEEFTCPEFDIVLDNDSMNCKIPGFPGHRWFFVIVVDPLIPKANTKTAYYQIIFYKGDKYLGDIMVNRCRRSPWPVSFPNLALCEDTPELRFFYPLPCRDFHQPTDWVIGAEIHECKKRNVKPDSPKAMIPAAHTILNRNSGAAPVQEFVYSYSQYSVKYKFEYRCSDTILGCPSWDEIPKWFELDPRDDTEEGPPGASLTGFTLPVPEPWLSPPLPKPSLDKSLLNTPLSAPILKGSIILEQTTEHPPRYSWGPQRKDPPPWKQNIRDIYRRGPVGLDQWQRVRSPLAGEISDREQLPARPEKSTVLQKAKAREKPMIPKFPRRNLDWLPPGWEVRYTSAYKMYYVNHKYKYTTWQIPFSLSGASSPRPLSIETKPKGESRTGKNTNQRSIKDTAVETEIWNPASNKLKQELLMKLAHTEANIQRCWLNDQKKSDYRWLETYFIHWYPGTSGFPTERIGSCLASNENLAQDAFKRHIRTLEEYRSFLQGSEISQKPRDPKSVIGQTTPLTGCEGDGYMASSNSDKKRKSDQLEGGYPPVPGVSSLIDSRGQIDYREDYGPEVPLTRDGKIDPHWHRDKIARVEEPYNNRQPDLESRY